MGGVKLAGKLAAALLSVAIAAPVFAMPELAESCCCLQAHRNCHCPSCAHRRAVELGQSELRTCGNSQAPAQPCAWTPVLPPQVAAVVPLPKLLRASFEPLPGHESPPREVLTPPPLC